MKTNFVHFMSPGTLTAEHNVQEIPSWDTEEAVRRAGSIEQRHGARPYAFYFTRRGRGPDDLDSKEVARSNLYYLGGRIETRAEIEARADPSERILLSNMRCNGWDRVIVNENSYRWTQPLEKDDVILDVTLPERAP